MQAELRGGWALHWSQQDTEMHCTLSSTSDSHAMPKLHLPARADPPVPAAGGRRLKLDCPSSQSACATDQRPSASSTSRPQCAAVPGGREQVGSLCKCAGRSLTAPHGISCARRRALQLAAPRCFAASPAAARCRHRCHHSLQLGPCTFRLLPWAYAAVAPHSNIHPLFAGWPALSAHRRHWRAPPLPPGVGTEPCRRAWRPCWPLSPHSCC